MSKQRYTYAPQTLSALRLLGRQFTAERRVRRWTQIELAARAGISVPTLISIEKGAPTVAIGTVFEVARLLGVPVVGSATDAVGRQLIEDRLAILPQRVTSTGTDVDDDF